MPLDRSQTRSIRVSNDEPKWFGLSHRSRAEQLLGLGIFLVVSFGMDFIHRKLFKIWLDAGLIQTQAPWALPYWPSPLFGTVCFLLVSLSMWGLWRRVSLKQLKPELSLYLSIFGMTILWSFSFFAIGESLVGLIALLFTSSILILAILLFWKKEKSAAQMLILPFFWIFYLASLTMFICTTGAS